MGFPIKYSAVTNLGDITFNISLNNQTFNYLYVKFTAYESIIIFDNTSVFGDLIYKPITGARQDRLLLTGYTTYDWNGQLDAKGFILNQDNIKQWQSNRRYTKGEIVIYQYGYWQAAGIVQPSTKFNYSDWYKSNYDRIQQGLLQNLATKADQLANSYDTQTANLNEDNDLLALPRDMT